MNLIGTIEDILFPRRCPVCHDIIGERGRLVCTLCEKKLSYIRDPYCVKCGKQLTDPEQVLCRNCSEKTIPFTEGRAVFLYDDTMKDSIYRFKYGKRKEYAKFYAGAIYDRYKNKIRIWNPDIIIPIPLHKSKLKKRGYNQAFLIAKELSHLVQIPTNDKILYRAKKTRIQKNLGVSDRESNIKNAFKIRPNKVQYLSAMLIDDIYTTGATMTDATRALKECGFERVFCISLSAGKDI